MATENGMYDPVADRWILKTPMPDIRHTFFAGTVRDTIYVAGGSYPDPENPSHALLPVETFGYDLTAE